MKPDARNCSKSSFFLLILNLYLLPRIINEGNPRNKKSSNKNGISFSVISLTALSDTIDEEIYFHIFKVIGIEVRPS
jgi:hypothetical protein